MSEHIYDWTPNKQHAKEEIVRCMDCKHYRPHEFVLITDIEHVCLFWAEGVKVAPDGYCAWGEKKEKEAVEVWQPASEYDVTCYETGDCDE